MKKLFGARSPAIQLSLDDEDELGGLSSGFGGCVVPCLPCLTPFNGIQLNVEDATLDDYLDPSTPTTIDALLDAHEESGPAALQSPRHYLTRNPFASTSKVTSPTVVGSGAHDEQLGSSAGALPWVDFFMEKNDDDAEFLSDHRISAVIDDTPKLAAQLDVFGSSSGQQQQDGGHSILDRDDEDDSFKPTRPFDIQSEWDEEPDDMYSTGGQQDEHHPDSDISRSPHLNDTSLDAPVVTCELQSLDNHPGDMTKDNGAINESQLMENVLTSSESINAQNNVPSNAGSPYISPKETSPSGHDFLALEENKTGGDISEATVASSPPSPALTNSTPSPSFPSPSLPRTPMPTLTQQPSDNSDALPSAKSSTPSPLPCNTNSEAYSRATMEVSMVPDDSLVGRRRSSVAAVAHSLLGDKLDDFTEKLAYIRKNIIMSLDDDEDDDDEYNEDNIKTTQPQQLRRSRSGSLRRQSFDPLVSKDQPGTSHRRSNSMMGINDDHRHFSPSSFFASLAGPDIPPQQYPPSNNNDDDEEEDLFDFSKVIAMGKNVRHYSEDLMGNGLRLFNDFSTRMKNANRGDDMPQDGEQPQQEQSSMDQEFLLGDTFF